MKTTMKLQRQTQLAMVGYGLIFASLVVTLLTSKGTDAMLPNIFVLGLTIPLTLYVINCTVVGGCKTYAWIHAYVSLFVGILFAIATIFVSAVSMKQ